MRSPSRYVGLVAARARFGGRVDALGPKFFEGDPLADHAVEVLGGWPHEKREALVAAFLEGGATAAPEAPEPVRALFAEVSRVPFWVDEGRLKRGAAAFLRSGVFGGLVLGTYSLILGYCSPAGNKPLVLSGRLEGDAARRLAETGRFVQAVSSPHGMVRGAPGFNITVRVRLMHAAVRRMALRSAAWKVEQWGLPINQVDMAGTILLFSLLVHDGVAKFGFPPTDVEREDLIHLWRYVAYLMGVCDELRCATVAEARTLWDLIDSTQDPPDDDSRALARALLESPIKNARTPKERLHAERSRPLAYAISRHMLGDVIADQLGYPRAWPLYGVKVFEQLNLRAPWFLRVFPRFPFGSVEAGVGYWNDVVNTSLAGVPATFPMPEGIRANPNL